MENKNTRRDEKRCLDCEYFFPSGTETGFCLRYPPAQQKYPPTGLSGFPSISPIDWCGEFKAKVGEGETAAPAPVTETAGDLVAKSRLEAVCTEPDEWKAQTWRELAKAYVQQRDNLQGAVTGLLKDRYHYHSLINEIGQMFSPAAWTNDEGMKVRGMLYDKVPGLVRDLVEAFQDSAGTNAWDKLRGAKPNTTTKHSPKPLCHHEPPVIGCSKCMTIGFTVDDDNGHKLDIVALPLHSTEHKDEGKGRPTKPAPKPQPKPCDGVECDWCKECRPQTAKPSPSSCCGGVGCNSCEPGGRG